MALKGMMDMKRVMRTGDSIWVQIYREQHGEDKDIEHHRGTVELLKNSRDAFLLPSGRIAAEREMFFTVDGDTIRSWNLGFSWVSINDFEIVGQDSKALKGSRKDMDDSVSGKEVGRLQIFRLARLLPDGRRDFEVTFHCKDYEGHEASLRIFNWNETDGSYEVEEFAEQVKGTHWTIKCPRAIDTTELMEYLNDQLKFFDTRVIYNFNGAEHIHNPPSKTEREGMLTYNRRVALPDNIGTAYVNYHGNGDFKVYNLGIKLRTPLDISVGGISGTIITDKFLPEDLGRGSLMQSDEKVGEVIQVLKVFGTEHLIERLKRTSNTELTCNELEFLLRKARFDTSLLEQIETRQIIPRGNGAFTSLKNIREMQQRGRKVYWASDEPSVNDHAMVGGMNVVVYSTAIEKLLEQAYEIDDATSLEDLPESKQWRHGYKLYENPPEIQIFYDSVLKPWLLIGMKNGLGSEEVPELKVGTKQGMDGWTNTKTYIVISRPIVNGESLYYYSTATDLAKLEFLRNSKCLEIMIHEIAHWGEGSDSFKVTLHSQEFNDLMIKVKFAIYTEMDKQLKELLKVDKDMALWITNLKTKIGSDKKPLYSVAIPRQYADELKLSPTSVLTVAIKKVKEDENFSKRGFSHKTEDESEEK